MIKSDKVGQDNGLHKVVQLFLDNYSAIPAIITVIGSVGLTLFASMLNLSEMNILQAVVGLLALIGASLLMEKLIEVRALRKSLNGISGQLGEALDYIHHLEDASPDDLITIIRDLPSLEERLEGAKQVFISGGSLYRLANEYQNMFEKLAENGCKLRFLLANPDGPSIESLSSGVVYESSDPESYRAQVRSSVATLTKLASRYPTLCEVRLYTLPPSFSLMIVEKEKDTSTILVEIYAFRLPTRDRPMLFLDKQRDPRLHELFSSQFKAMWESKFSHPISLENGNAKSSVLQVSVQKSES